METNMTNTIKAGDEVRIVDSARNRVHRSLKPHINSVFEVGSIDGRHLALVDFPGDVGRASPELFYRTRFEKVTRANDFQRKDYIICLKEGGVYKPSTAPRVFSTREQALKVARDMANKHRGRFVVFGVIAFAELPVKDAMITELN